MVVYVKTVKVGNEESIPRLFAVLSEFILFCREFILFCREFILFFREFILFCREFILFCCEFILFCCEFILFCCELILFCCICLFGCNFPLPFHFVFPHPSSPKVKLLGSSVGKHRTPRLSSNRLDCISD